jgi:hypothetical protein
MVVKRAWGIGIGMKRACVSQWSHQGAEGLGKSSTITMVAQHMVNASKREVYFHVESQHLSEFAIPYHI